MVSKKKNVPKPGIYLNSVHFSLVLFAVLHMDFSKVLKAANPNAFKDVPLQYVTEIP